ncbi:Alpha/Beta hydrolase protein [Xylaria palmicola]|nr:Alpha/Beta hydrolase protein [Xylaria palmicola]
MGSPGALPPFDDIECTTIDGTTLRGWLYSVKGPAPAVIMSHGLNCVKEMRLPALAKYFQSMGYNVLLYDMRGLGASDGLPRNQLDPLQAAQDISDIVTHMSNLPSVDSRRILLWGFSFGGMVSGCAAAIDSRLAAVAMVAPLLSFVRPDRRKAVLALCAKDRESQLRGDEPLTLPPFTPMGDNPAGLGGAGGPGGLALYHSYRRAVERGYVNFVDRMTLQSYIKMMLSRPKELLQTIDGVPVMLVIPELDNISPAAEQLAVFETLQSPKRVYLARGEEHLTVLAGKGSGEMLAATHQFFQDALHGNVSDIAEARL